MECWTRTQIFAMKYITVLGVGLLLIVLCALAGFFASAGLWRDAIFASDVGFFIDTILIACSHHIIILMNMYFRMFHCKKIQYFQK